MSSVVSAPLALDRAEIRPVWCPFHVTLATFVAMMTSLFCGQSISDPDIWWHLRNAQILFQQHHWVRWDQFSYTVAGTPWINTEWLSEVIFYGAWHVAGHVGIFVLYAAVAEGIMLGLLYLSVRVSGSVKAATLASTLGVLLAVVNFGPRTILFGWACLLALMFVLWRFIDTGEAPLWRVPVIFLLWVNLHGSWLIGLVVFSIVIASGFVSGSWGGLVATKWNRTQVRQLLTAWLSVIPVLFINPYGYRYVFYPFDMAYRQKLNISHVEEWASVDFHDPRGKIVFGVVMLILILMLTARRRWRLVEVGLVAFALYASITYIRFLFLAAILITPILARHISTIVPPYKREIDRSWLNFLYSAALLVVAIHRFPTGKMLQDDLAKKFPIKGINYLHQHASPTDRVVNHYMFGGYMIWSTPPVPTFIDSRTDIFEYKGVLKDYLDMIGMKDSLGILDRYKARYVLFPPKDPVSYLLKHTPGWKVVYEDETSCVFERSNAKS